MYLIFVKEHMRKKNLNNKAVKHKNKRDNHNLMWKSENLLFT